MLLIDPNVVPNWVQTALFILLLSLIIGGLLAGLRGDSDDAHDR